MLRKFIANYSYQVGYANFMNFKPFWGCSGFFVLEKRRCSPARARSDCACAPSFGPHTFFIRSKQSEESVWTERRRARAIGRARDVRTTKKGLKFYKICIPILVEFFCCDLIATGPALINYNSGCILSL